MKSLLLVVMGLLLIGTVANASEIIADNDSGVGTAWAGSRAAFSMTQNLGAPIALTDGVYTCGNVTLGYTTESWSMRRFSPYWEFGLDGPLNILDVDWGIRRFVALLDSIPNDIVVDLELYSIPSDAAMLWANMTLIATFPNTVTMADNPIAPSVGTWRNTLTPGVIFNPLGGTVDLVVAIHQPEGFSTTPATRFACSANNAPGQTAYPYYVFADCGFAEPATPGDLNPASPDVAEFVLIINGEEGSAPPLGACCDAAGLCTMTVETACVGTWHAEWLTCDPNPCPPVPVETKSWGEVKSLYR